ncbi:MAG: hypothetical protein ABL921_33550, partial [Pirellula sp.]
NREPDVLFDTKSILFTSSSSNLKFPIDRDESFRVYKPMMPFKLMNLSQAMEMTGFTPVKLPKIPLGFVVRETTAMKSVRGSYVAQRWTDGIVSASMYQFASTKNPFGPSSDGLDFVVNDVTLRLVGDIPYEGKRIIMEQCARSLGRTFRPTREPFETRKGFPIKRTPEHESEPEASSPCVAMQNMEKSTETLRSTRTAVGRAIQISQRTIKDEQHN